MDKSISLTKRQTQTTRTATCTRHNVTRFRDMASPSQPSSFLLSHLGKRSVAEHFDWPCRKGSRSLDFRFGYSCPGSESQAETTSTLGPACRHTNSNNDPATEVVANSSSTRGMPFCLVNHCHSDQRLANCDSKNSYTELVTPFLVATAAGAVVVTTQPQRRDWMSRIDDDLLVARMQMLNRGRKCDGGKKLESAM